MSNAVAAARRGIRRSAKAFFILVRVLENVCFDYFVGNQGQDNHQVKQIYSNKCLFPMLHQIAPVREPEHPDHKAYGEQDQQA